MSFKEIGLVLLFLAAWIVLNRWVLPWFGISTCMSGSCGVDRRPAVGHDVPERVGEQEAFSECTGCLPASDGSGCPSRADEPPVAP